jgi:hypothetical protein
MKKLFDFIYSDGLYMILVLLSAGYLVTKGSYGWATIQFGLFILIALKINSNKIK